MDVELGGPREMHSATARRRNGLLAPFNHPLTQTVVRRLMLATPLLFVVSALTFVLTSFIPGNPAVAILGPEQTQATYDKLISQLGLDLPVYEQYWRWISQAVSGNLGASFFSGEPVTQIITERLSVTLSLVSGSILVISIVGVGLGVFSAVRGGAAGRVVDAFSLIGFSLPGYWLGAVLIGFFAVSLGWLPSVGYVSFAESPSSWARSLVLPVAALAVNGVAVVARQTREAMLDALASEHIRMAWATGIPARDIYFRLALKNASMPVITIIGIQVVGLLLGTVFVEQVFALPGLGSALASAALQGDLPVVQGITVFFTLVIVGVNLFVDLSYAALNPRVRAS
jgi:peptide/nickel transport system permease protein